MPWDDNLRRGSAAYGVAASTHTRIRVLAGPGAGKSLAMKRRVARILESKRSLRTLYYPLHSPASLLKTYIASW